MYVHVYATYSLLTCHGASGYTLLVNPPSIFTFAWCYGAVKHLLCGISVLGGVGRHARYCSKHTLQQAAAEQSPDVVRKWEKVI